jgi:hypothetical protein
MACRSNFSRQLACARGLHGRVAKTDLVLMTGRSCGPNNVFVGVSLCETNTTCLKLKKPARSPAAGFAVFALRPKDSEIINKKNFKKLHIFYVFIEILQRNL